MSRLPTIGNCPECKQKKKDAANVSVFKRLGPLPPRNKHAESSRVEDLEELEDDDEEEDSIIGQGGAPMGSAFPKAKGSATTIRRSTVAQLDCGPRPVIFEKPRERSYRHLKALYLRGYINGQPVNKMLVDTGAAVNIMPYSMLRRLGRSSSDLIKTNVTLSDFNGQVSDAQGVLNVDLTVGRKAVPTTFFIVDSKSSYAVLLGRDWIHANCCIPSTMHQCLIQWDGDEVEVVHADDSAEISTAGMNVWETSGQEPLSGINLDDCERIDVTKDGVRLVLSTGLTV
ncbi:hypothetical protein QYE76_024651 [Lolium multiflorum]|uniref:Gag-pol polyprotein n=1 Tax=Lolium multiflorum TaxID=4521 RepID=A0AAD8RFD4_LOLMU|nr:hypothetical protein QYE76_024651 [Lolium multiflorum]